MKINYLSIMLIIVMAMTSCTGKLYSYRKTYKVDPAKETLAANTKKEIKSGVPAEAEAPLINEEASEGINTEAVASAAPEAVFTPAPGKATTAVRVDQPAVSKATSMTKAEVKAMKKELRAAKKDIKQASAVGIGSMEVRLIIAGLICILIAAILGGPAGYIIYVLGAILLIVGLVLLLLNIL